MKTIAFIDKGDGNKTLRAYKPEDPINHLFNLFMQKRKDLVIEAVNELKHVGNIKVYLIDNNKTRFLFERS